MKIHLKQIPAQGLHLDGDEGCPIHDLEAEGIRCAGQLHYNIDVGIAGGALWSRGSLSQPVELSCVSCLEKFVHEIEVPGFAVHMELNGPETVDLTPLCGRIFCLTCQRIRAATEMAIVFARGNNWRPLSKTQSGNWIGVRWTS